MTTISATGILSSVHAVTGDRLDTILLRYPRFIHAEFLTHRKFSKNSSSSRAIPVKKLIEDVERDPVVPLVWTKNQPGMQGYEVLGSVEEMAARDAWRYAKEDAVYRAKDLAALGAHKQIVNRLLEPFAHITVLVSSTSWTNFLALRDHPAAEPHIQMLAREVRKTLDSAEVQVLEPGEWHLPFLTDEDFAMSPAPISMEDAKMLSVARCASTSYKTVDDFDMTLDRARVIYEKLRDADPIHASPFEHVAQADGFRPSMLFDRGHYEHPEQHRNFDGFRQLRAMVEA